MNVTVNDTAVGFVAAVADGSPGTAEAAVAVGGFGSLRFDL